MVDASVSPSKQMAWSALFPAYSDASRIGQPRSYDPLLERYATRLPRDWLTPTLRESEPDTTVSPEEKERLDQRS